MQIEKYDNCSIVNSVENKAPVWVPVRYNVLYVRIACTNLTVSAWVRAFVCVVWIRLPHGGRPGIYKTKTTKRMVSSCSNVWT